VRAYLAAVRAASFADELSFVVMPPNRRAQFVRDLASIGRVNGSVTISRSASNNSALARMGSVILSGGVGVGAGGAGAGAAEGIDHGQAERMQADLLKMFIGGGGGNNIAIPTRLLYRASRDGFTSADWRARVPECGPTLTVVRVKGSNNVFGAYVATSFPMPSVGDEDEAEKDEEASYPDFTGSSFLFSLENKSSRPLRFKLADKFKSKALGSRRRGGPMFGSGNANCLGFMVNGPANAPRANNDYGAGEDEAFQPDFDFERANNGGEAEEDIIKIGKGWFAGNEEDAEGNALSGFACAEIEVFGLPVPSVPEQPQPPPPPAGAAGAAVVAPPIVPSNLQAPINLRLFRSSILTDHQQAQSLSKFFKPTGMPCPTRLLYRASRDGFLAKDWQSRCVERGPTLTLVRSAGGCVFGAFTAVSWPSPSGLGGGGGGEDEDAPGAAAAGRAGEAHWSSKRDVSRLSFLFSLKNSKQRALRFKLVARDKAVGSRKDWGPLFGYGATRNLQLFVEGKAANAPAGCWSVITATSLFSCALRWPSPVFVAHIAVAHCFLLFASLCP
jgi:hypothetical protein